MMQKEVDIIKKRLNHTGFEIIEYKIPSENLILFGIKNRDIDDIQKKILVTRGRVVVKVGNTKVYEGKDVIEVGTVKRDNNSRLWTLPIWISESSGERYAREVNAFPADESLYEHVILDSFDGQFSIGHDIRETAKNGYVENMVYLINSEEFARTLEAVLKTGELPSEVELEVVERAKL